MVNGQSGQRGRSALIPVVKGTGQGCELAASLQPNMEAGPAKAEPWRSSCAASSPVLVNGLSCIFLLLGVIKYLFFRTLDESGLTEFQIAVYSLDKCTCQVQSVK